MESRDVDFTLTNTTLTETGAGIVGSEVDTISGFQLADLTGGVSANTIDASAFTGLSTQTELGLLNGGLGIGTTDEASVDLTGLEISTPLAMFLSAPPVVVADFTITMTNGATANVDADVTWTLQDLIDAVSNATAGKVTAALDASGMKLVLTDTSGGAGDLTVAAAGGSTVASDLGILKSGSGGTLTGDVITDFSSDIRVILPDARHVDIDLSNLTTIQDVLDAINGSGPAGQLTAALNAGATAIVITSSVAGAGNLQIQARDGCDRCHRSRHSESRQRHHAHGRRHRNRPGHARRSGRGRYPDWQWRRRPPDRRGGQRQRRRRRRHRWLVEVARRRFT